MTTTPTPTSPTQLSVAFSPREDRLLLWLGADLQSAQLQLTRRLVARLLNAMAEVLAKSSIPASRAPADLRDGLVLFEHQDVLAGATAQQSMTTAAADAAPTRTGPVRLVDTVNITTRPTVFELSFVSTDGAPFAVTLGRPDLHRDLEMLLRQSAAADWAISLDAEWINIAPTLN